MILLYPELQVEQSPSESQFVHPVLFPFGPQQFPPLQEPLLHWLLDKHVPPSVLFDVSTRHDDESLALKGLFEMSM